MSDIPEPSFNNDYRPKPFVCVEHPEWSKNATIYEVNIRQFTPAGTFNDFATHLPRLKRMGVDILWLMPIHPIGLEKRKGVLGSYYSVQDYLSINPEFGSVDDFKNLVLQIHSLGMYVIIDWVANHSSWDNSIAIEHPEWYTHNKSGAFTSTPWFDWDDIIDFDFDCIELRRYMTDAMKYWVKELDIDGFRCDAAGFVPTDFWDNVRKELALIKPVFMLAEWESRDLHQRAFDMTYSWSLWEKMREATSGGKGTGPLVDYIAQDVNSFPRAAYRMTFTDNHDKNSWDGNQYTYFGEGLEACIVFSNMVNGMPLCYGGQEAGLDRSLKFFDKDEIIWKSSENEVLFSKLFQLKHINQALWNGQYGGEMIQIRNNTPQHVISFFREKNDDAIICMVNFSKNKHEVMLESEFFVGTYMNWFTGDSVELKAKSQFILEPWGYKVLVKSF